MQLTQKNLLGIKDLSINDIQTILQTSTHFKEILQRVSKQLPSLRDLTVVNLFYENSTRTRISFELAEKRLGASIINFTTSGSSSAKGETLLDTVKNILRMKVDMVVVRHSASGVPHFLAKQTNAIIINAGDGTNEHPTQALQDAYSIQEKFGKIEGVKVAIIGDILHSRVAPSNIYLLTKMGAEVMICAPPTLLPKYLKEAFPLIHIEYDLEKTLRWCDVANVLRIQLERQNQPLFSSLREYNLSYGIKKNILHRIDKEIVIMHPGPINRGVEIDSDIADSEQSIILDQVENGVAIRMGVIYLFSGSPIAVNTK